MHQYQSGLLSAQPVFPIGPGDIAQLDMVALQADGGGFRLDSGLVQLMTVMARQQRGDEGNGKQRPDGDEKDSLHGDEFPGEKGYSVTAWAFCTWPELPT